MKLSYYILALVFVIGLTLALLWPTWWLWCFVLGAMWPSGPQAIIAPSYWLFVGMWFLAGWAGNVLFGQHGLKE